VRQLSLADVSGSRRYGRSVNLRALSDDERRLLDFLLSAEFEGRDALRRQAASARTAGTSCTCGCPSFYLNPDRSLASAPVTERVPVEAHGRDPGGHLVGVLLFVDDGYLSELEVFGYESPEFAGLPRPDDLEISQWGKPDEDGVRRLLSD